VAADVGGLAALVDAGTTGLLVAERDPRAWADAVEWVTADPLLAMRLSTAAVLRAQRYTWRAAAARFDTIVRTTRASRLVSCA
jgi:D-inositol-3-phosphate glycosyltransferase